MLLSLSSVSEFEGFECSSLGWFSLVLLVIFRWSFKVVFLSLKVLSVIHLDD